MGQVITGRTVNRLPIWGHRYPGNCNKRKQLVPNCKQFWLFCAVLPWWVQAGTLLNNLEFASYNDKGRIRADSGGVVHTFARFSSHFSRGATVGPFGRLWRLET